MTFSLTTKNDCKMLAGKSFNGIALRFNCGNKRRWFLLQFFSKWNLFLCFGFSICEFHPDGPEGRSQEKRVKLNDVQNNEMAAGDKIQVIRSGLARYPFYERQFNIKFYALCIGMKFFFKIHNNNKKYIYGNGIDDEIFTVQFSLRNDVAHCAGEK